MSDSPSSDYLPDSEFARYELVSFAIIGIGMALPGVGFLLGQFADYWVIWNSVEANFITPIAGEGGGDSSYNPVDTAAYGILLAAFVVAISAILRKLDIPSKDRFVYALMPWVMWAVLVEVHEDAGLWSETTDFLFVSPLIHFQTAFWIIAVSMCACVLDSKLDFDDERAHVLPFALAGLMSIVHMLIFFDRVAIWITIALASAPVLYALQQWESNALTSCIDRWTTLEKVVFYSGMTACMLPLISLILFGMDRADTGDVVVWPALVVLGFPAFITIIAWQRGKEEYAEVISSGRIPGVLIAGQTLREWEDLEGDEHDANERLIRRAAFGTPIVLIAFFGQLVDGFASMVGVDIFYYSEKHVLSTWVMKLAGGDDSGSGGGWGFLIVKMFLAVVVILFYAEWRFEDRQKHLRLLILMACLTVGLAPGLRDLGRLMLGV